MTKIRRGAEPPSQADLPAGLPGRGIFSLKGSTLSPQPVDWLWHPYIPRGMLTALSGDPEAGKSWITANLTACLTSGTPFPMQETYREPENVIMLNSEDAVEETQVPRLLSMGADMSRVFLVRQGFSIGKNTIADIRDYVLSTNASLLTIDPIQSFMGQGYDMNRATDVRAWTDLLTTLAKETGLAVVMVGHKRKSKKSDGDDNPLYQGLGSIDFVGASRSVLHARVDDAGTRVFEHVKASVGYKGDPIAYAVERSRNGESPFRWLGPYEGIAHKRAQGLSPAHEFACEWLADKLWPEPRMADELQAEAERLDPPINVHTLKKAKQEVADSIRRGNKWWWMLKPGLQRAKEHEEKMKNDDEEAV